MARKRKLTADDVYDAKYYGKSSASDNAPESSSLTQDERAYVEAGLQALALLRKTLESWLTVGKAIQMLRKKADRIGGKKTFTRLLDQNDYGYFGSKKGRSTCTRLLRIMENVGEVVKWHAGLEPNEQAAWAHPNTVFLHCPIFQKDGAPNPRPQPAIAKPENLAKVVEQQDARIEELQEEIAALKAHGPAEQSTPTYDQAVEIIAAKLAAMPQAKMMEAMKAIHLRIAAAKVENTERKRVPKKSKGVKGVGLNFGEALTDAVDKLIARESSR